MNEFIIEDKRLTNKYYIVLEGYTILDKLMFMIADLDDGNILFISEQDLSLNYIYMKKLGLSKRLL